MALPAPIKAPFITESDCRALTRTMSAARSWRIWSPTDALIMSSDTLTIRILLSAPPRSVIQTVAPGTTVDASVRGFSSNA